MELSTKIENVKRTNENCGYFKCNIEISKKDFYNISLLCKNNIEHLTFPRSCKGYDSLKYYCLNSFIEQGAVEGDIIHIGENIYVFDEGKLREFHAFVDEDENGYETEEINIIPKKFQVLKQLHNLFIPVDFYLPKNCEKINKYVWFHHTPFLKTLLKNMKYSSVNKALNIEIYAIFTTFNIGNEEYTILYGYDKSGIQFDGNNFKIKDEKKIRSLLNDFAGILKDNPVLLFDISLDLSILLYGNAFEYGKTLIVSNLTNHLLEDYNEEYEEEMNEDEEDIEDSSEISDEDNSESL